MKKDDVKRIVGFAGIMAVGMAAMYGFMWLYSLAAYIDNL